MKATGNRKELKIGKTKDLSAYIEKRADAFGKRLKCPNHSDGVKFEDFKKAAFTLRVPFSKAVHKYHAEKWS
jgi:hypothetical protein